MEKEPFVEMGKKEKKEDNFILILKN